MRLRKSYWLLPLLVLSCVFILTASIPNVPTGAWQTWNPMGDVRSGAAAVLLQDGRVLIIGGSNANGPVASADLFGKDGNFSAAAVMQSPRSGHTATVLSDGRVLVAGGTTSGGGITNSAEIYDPTANSWTLLSGTMVDARSGHTASLLPDGRVLLAGGESSGGAINGLEIFDPSSGNFSGAGVMTSARMNHAAASLQDGRVLLLGGSDGTNPLASVDVFDPGASPVSAGPNLSSPRVSASATTTLDGKVVVIGGNNGASSGPADLAIADILVADPSTGQISSSLSASNLLTPRSGHQSFLLPKSNAILVIGGSSSGTNLNSAELYYPWADTFQATSSMSVPRPGFVGSAISHDGMFLAAGGTNLSSTELYGFATVKTDALDYPPGSTVTITGSGWQHGETVTLTLVESPLIDTHGPFTTVADANGNISNSSFVTDAHDADVKFTLTTVGSASQAQTTFTDSTATNTSLTSAPNSSSAGQSVTFTATVRTGNTQGSGTLVTSGTVGFYNQTGISGPNCNTKTGTQIGTQQNVSGSGTGTVSFTFSSGGAYTIGACYTGTGGNGTANSQSNSITQTVNQAPAINSTASTTFTVGTAGSFTVTATGFPATTFSETGALPSGVTLSSAGVLSGTPAANTGGTYPITITASNGVSPNATQNFTLTVNQAPAITSTASTTFTEGTAGSFAVTATGNPAPSIAESGSLPSGVTYNSTTQVLSGTPAAGTGGTYNITFTASNGVAPNAVQNFTLTVNQALSITSAASTTFTVGSAGSFTVTATGFPAPTFSETGALPSGVTLSSAGVLSGTPAANTGGTYPITITASNGISPNATQNFKLTVTQSPAITSANNTTFTVSAAGTFTVMATGFPTTMTFSETGSLPSGVTLSSAGVLSGTATVSGTFPIAITASNGVTPNATQNFTLTVGQAPAITSANNATFTVDSAGSFTATATGFPAPTFSETGALPSGVTLTTAGVLSGTPALGSVGSYPITIKASNGINPDAPQAFTLTVNKATAAFTTLTASQSIAYGTTTISLSGRVSGPPVLTGTVSIAINGTTVSDIPLNGNPNNFGPVTFNTSTIPASTTPYTITYSYSGDANSTTATDTSTTLTVNKATAAFSNLASQTITYGTASVTLTGTISAATGLPPTTETVSITINGSTMATPIGSNGAFSASFDTHAIPASVTPNTITYNYAGDTNFSSASNAGTTLTINKAASHAALGSSLNPSFSGQQVTFTATITVPAGVPVGTVQFQEGGVDLGSPVAVSNNGGVFTAKLQTASLSVATHNITAIYSGNANFNGSTSNTVAQVVKSAVTITSISAPTITYGADGSVTVTVAAQDPSAGTPSGNVTLSVNGGAPITHALVGGSTTFTITKPDAGSYSLSANYAAQGNFNASSTTGTLQVNPAQATLSFGPLAFTYDGNPKPVSVSTTPADLTGVSITYSGGTAPTIAGSYTVGASLTNPNYTATPISGTETISPAPVAVTVPDTTVPYDGTPKSVTAVLSPAVAFAVTYTGISPTVYATSFTVPTEPGSYTVVATVTNPNYTGSGSGTLTISQKDPALVLALLTGMPEPSAYGTRAYFELTTATSPCPTGQVDFYVDGSSTSNQTVNLSDSPCTHQPIEFSTATLMPGTHSVSAVYSGDAHYLNQTSPPVSHQVVADATTVTLATSATEVFVGDSVTLTATVTPATPLDGTAATPTGTVQFYDNTTTLLDQKPLTMNGSAFITVLNINSLAAGPHSITATYVSANGDFAGSSSPVSLETVDKITPTITWANPADIVYGTKLNGSQLNVSATDAHNGNIPVAGTFVYDPATDTLLAAGTRNLSVTFTPADTNTYTSQTATVTINVTAATLTVTADDASRPYGADNPTFTFKYSGFVNNENSAAVTTAPTCTTTATSSSIVGTYSITCSGGFASNYTFNYVDGKLTVNAATLTASIAGDPTKTYDGNTTATLNAGNFSLSGVVGNDSITVTKTTGTYNSADVSTANTVTVNLASTDFTAGTGTLLTNYALPTSASGPGHITKANSVITVTPYSLTYDGNSHTATGTAKGVKGESLTGLDLSSTTHTNAQDYPSDPWTFTDSTGNYNNANGTTHDHIDKANAAIVVTPYSLTYDGNPHTATGTAKGVETSPADLSSLLHLDGTTHTAAGDYPSDAWTFDGNGNYNATSGTVHDHIDKANAAIVVTPYNLTYDGNPHTATDTATGVKGESLSGLDLSGTTHSNAGTYATDVWTFTDVTGNYNNASGTVSDSIAKANATINVTPYSVTYDGNAHTATGTATGVKGEALSGLNLTGTTHTSAGTYATDVWTFTDVTGNYNNASGTVSDSIAKANATINVTPYSVTYDGNAHTTTGTATGVKGETLSGLNLTGTTHTSAGTYATDVWTFTDSTGNYNSASGTVSDSIDKANATIVVTPYSLTYDGNPHTATGTAKGVETIPADLSSLLHLDGTTHTAAGDYLTDGWTFDGNGNYNPASGTVHDSIARANAVIHVAPYSVTYDGNPHTARGTAVGVKGEALSGLDLSGTTHIPSGNYASDPWTFTDSTGNYNNANGTVSDAIAKANATITVTAYNVSYDHNAHTATGSVTGVKGEALSGLDLSGTTHTNAGNYTDSWAFTDITGNYNNANGTVNDAINKITLTIAAVTNSKTYDGTTSAAGIPTVSGLKGSDTVTGRTESYSDKNAGTGKTLIVNSGYVVNDGNGGNNYSVMLVNNATGVINPAPLTGQANNATNVYGHALPSLTVTYSGFVGGDTLASLSGALSCVTSAAAWSPVSGNPYSITCSGQSSINYTITYLPGTLTVTQATTSVSVASSANPSILNASVTFTATVSPQYSGVPTGTVTFKDGSNTIGTGTLNGSGIATYTTSALGAGSHSITASYAGDGNFTGNSGSMTQSVQYLSGGTCAGDAGHQILQPINTDGSSVWKQGSTVPAKFRVCDVNGVSIGTTGVIAGFVLYRINSGTIAPVDETTDNSTNDLGWHFDSTAQQWIFNMSTKTAPQNVANRTYYYQITLNDGSTILFDFGLK